MKRQTTLKAVILLAFTLSALLQPSSAATLSPDDFKLESFSKVVDFFDYARQHAAGAGKSPPPADWHAYLYQVYINHSGFQLFYSGLINMTAGQGALTIPVQSFLEHYKTPGKKDVLTSSSFIMLLAFNDTTALIPDSPDKNDNLYASFSLGLDLTDIFQDSNKPALSSKTEIIPLTWTSDKLTWEWGMRYTNLTAVWWKMFIDPLNPRFEILPIAITTYEELTFTYKLTLNPSDGTAKVESSYVLGRMTNLWLIQWLLIIPVVVHLNSTGTYRLNGSKISDQTIHQFLEKQRIKMSIVLFQNSLALNYQTESTYNNQNVTDTETDVSNGAIATEAGNEKIFEADFGTKSTYKLYNYTAGNTATEYEAVTRTAPRPGYAKNPLFSLHVALLKYVPIIVAHIDPQLFQRAKEHMLNMTYADYFYIISYPKYSGYKIEHDPTYTAYIASTAGTTEPSRLAGLILLCGIAIVVVVGLALVLRRRRPRTQATQPAESTPTTPTV